MTINNHSADKRIFSQTCSGNGNQFNMVTRQREYCQCGQKAVEWVHEECGHVDRSYPMHLLKTKS